MTNDTCMFYLKEAADVMNNYKKVDPYKVLFEATEDPTSDSAVAEAQNGKIVKKSQSLLGKAIMAIQAIYVKIKDVLGNIIRYATLSKDDKGSYRSFVEKARQNPQFKNTKITVKDWKSIENNYNALCKQITDEIKRIDRTNEELKPNVMNKIKDGLTSCKSFAQRAGVQVLLDKQINAAKTNASFASDLEGVIKYETAALHGLGVEINEKDVEKAKKKARALNSKIWLRRYLAGARKACVIDVEKAQKENNDIMSETIKSLTKTARSYAKENISAKDVAKFGSNVISSAASDVHDSRKELKEKKKELKRLKRDN